MSSKGKVNTGTVRGLGFFCYFIRCGFLFCFWLPVTFLSLKIKRIDKDLGLCYLSSFETMLAFLNGSTQVFFFQAGGFSSPKIATDQCMSPPRAMEREQLVKLCEIWDAAYCHNASNLYVSGWKNNLKELIDYIRNFQIFWIYSHSFSHLLMIIN